MVPAVPRPDGLDTAGTMACPSLPRSTTLTVPYVWCCALCFGSPCCRPAPPAPPPPPPRPRALTLDVQAAVDTTVDLRALRLLSATQLKSHVHCCCVSRPVTLRLEERLGSTKESLSAEIASVGSSAASASAESAGQEALGEQLAALDQKLSAANAAQASWLEQQLAQVSADTSAKISEVELSAQTLALEAEGKAMDAVSATVSTAVAELERSIETAAAGMEEGVAGVRLPSNSLHACRCKHHAHAAQACRAVLTWELLVGCRWMNGSRSWRRAWRQG